MAPIQRVPLRTVLTVTFVGFAAILCLPLRSGEAVRPVLMHRRGRLSGWAATGAVAAERIIDGLCVSIMLLVALGVATPLDPLPDRIGTLPVPAAGNGKLRVPATRTGLRLTFLDTSVS